MTEGRVLGKNGVYRRKEPTLIITKNTVVTYHFVLKDEKNQVLDTSGEEPFTYLHGYQHILPLLEEALTGKTVNDEVTVTVPPDRAYGKRDEHLVRVFNRSQFPQSDELTVGMRVYSPVHQQFVMKIIQIDGDNITIDANHPLAGMSLVFEIKVLSVREATSDEIKQQQVHP